MADPVNIRIPSAAKRAEIFDTLQNDEDWRFTPVKPDRDKPRFFIPAPTPDDADNIRIEKTFHAVVVVARKNFYQSPQDKEEGKDAKEKRALYILREGKLLPEVVYISPTSLRAWREWVVGLVREEKPYHAVVVEFGLVFVSPKGSDYKWNKYTFKTIADLDEPTFEYIEALKSVIEARVKVFEDMDTLAEYEELALSGSTKKKVDDAEEAPNRAAKQRTRQVEEDDEPAPPPKKKAAPVEDDEEPAPTPKRTRKPAPPVEEDEETLPAKSRKPAPPVEEDDDTPPPPKKRTLDDDDD
jgi:hypothetical protein